MLISWVRSVQSGCEIQDDDETLAFFAFGCFGCFGPFVILRLRINAKHDLPAFRADLHTCAAVLYALFTGLWAGGG